MSLTDVLAPLRADDTVRVRVSHFGHDAEVSGVLWDDGDGDLCLASVLVRRVDGAPGRTVTALLSHTPAPPSWATDPDVVAVRVRAVVWVRLAEAVAGCGEWVTTNGSYWTTAQLIERHGDAITVYARRAES